MDYDVHGDKPPLVLRSQGTRDDEPGEIERAFVGIFPYFFGDFSDMVFHRARCPVLVVRGEEARRYSDAFR